MEIYKNIPGFMTGEIAPSVSARVDFDKYNTACERLENFLIKAQGPVTRRPGSRYVATTKTSSKKSRMITFKFNVTDSRILEFGDGYIRVYKSNSTTGVGEQVMDGGNPVEIASPYLEAHIWEIDHDQDADVMYLTHPKFSPRKLSRTSDTSWSLSEMSFRPPPSYIDNTDLNTTITISNAAIGEDRTFTTAASNFRESDIGRALIAGAGRAIITGYTSKTELIGDVVETFASTTPAINTWYLTGSPVGSITPMYNKPIGRTTVLVMTDSNGETATATSTAKTVRVTSSSHTLVVGDYVVMDISDSGSSSGAFKVTAISAGAWFEYTARATPGLSAKSCTYYPFIEGFRDITNYSDIGKYIKMNEGLLQIKNKILDVAGTKIVAVKVEILNSPKNKDMIFAGNWSLEVRSWSKTDGGTADENQGYPSLVGGHQNRRLLASTSNQPTTVWGSVTGNDNENFATGVKDDDALDYTLSTRNKLRWLLTHRVIIVGTGGEEIMFGAENNKALTPTNVRAIIQSNIGGAAVKPLLVNSAILFLQKSKNKLWEFTYNFEEDSYKGVDMTILAEHITLPTLGGTNWNLSGIVDMAYQKEPTPIIWCVRNDGMLLALTYQRNDNVVGWGKHITGQLDAEDPPVTNGWVESVCIEPVNGRDRVWLIVQRLINGSYRRYVEYFDDNAWTSAEGWQWGELLSDSAKVYSGAAITTMTGLDHLAGKTVCVLGDGKLQTGKTVPTSAPFNITIDSASHVEVGLPYVSIGITVRPETQLRNGTIQGRQKGWATLVARLHNTMGGYLNDTPMEYNVVAGVKTLFTGDYEVHNLGYDKGGRVCFEQWDPLPFTILSLSGKLTVGV